MLQQHVSRLRKALAAGGAAQRSSRAAMAMSCASIPRTCAASGGSSGLVAAGAAREALALWRGPPLADLAYEPFAARRSGGWRSCG